MKFYVAVFYQKKILFTTDPASCPTPDAFVAVYSAIRRRFLEADGFDIQAAATVPQNLCFEIDELHEAINNGNGKGYIMSLRSKQRKAHWMAYVLFKQLEKGLW